MRPAPPRVTTAAMRIAVKICGFRRPEDVQLAADLDIDAIGVVLDAGPTQVSRSRADEIRRAAAPLPFETIVVAGPAGPHEIRELVDAGFDRVQAVVTPETLRAVPADRVLPVFFDDDDLEARLERVLGAPVPSSPRLPFGCANVDGKGGGGRGIAANWVRAARAARRYPLMLSGGLRDDNVGEAIRQVMPVAVDVSSFTEASDGKKSRDRIARFVRAVREAERATGSAQRDADSASGGSEAR